MTVYVIGYESPTNPLPSKRNLDGDPLLVETIDKTPLQGRTIVPGGEALVSGRAVEATHLPNTLMIKNGVAGVTDYDGYHSVIFVSPRFKNIIEELEPNVHQFFPITLVDGQKRHLADHWIWVICSKIETIDADESVNWTLQKGHLYTVSDKQNARLVFSKAKIGRHHFWWEQYMLPGRWKMASELAAARMQDAQLTGLIYKTRETI